MTAMSLATFLVISGWVPVDPEELLWIRAGEDEPVTIWWAAHKQGLDIPHLWDLETMACKFCGMTQYRVLVQGESYKCMGVPDVKAFQDSADYAKISERIKRAINGEDGMLWDKNE